MSALACLVVSTFLAYLIAQFQKRSSSRKSTTAWQEASELVFDRNLRFHIKLEYETGAAPSNSEPNLLMLANMRLEIEPSRREAEEFVCQHCDLDDDLMEGMWISRFS